MKTRLSLLAILLSVMGCGQGIARLDQLSRVQAATLTDATSLGGTPQGGARPPVHITDPDRLAALEEFLKARRMSLKPIKKSPRPTRFQLELTANDRSLYTIWLEPGYLALGAGKSFREARLSNADTAELLACLGLPADYLNPYPGTFNGAPVIPAAYPPPGYAPEHQPILPVSQGAGDPSQAGTSRH